MYQVYKSKEVTILMNGILLDKNICFDTYTCAGQFVMLFGTEGQDFGTSSSISGLSFKGKTLIYPSGVGRTEGVKSQNSSAGSGDQVQLENDKNTKCKVDVKHN